MTKFMKALVVVALSATVAFAGDAKSDKDLKKVIEDQGIYVETSQPGIVLSGYVDASYTYQFASSTEAPVGTRNAGNENLYRTFDVDNNDFNLNAFKLALEKSLSKKNEFSAGFRADLMFGEDARILNNLDRGGVVANEQVFLEQAYVQFRAPVGNGLDFKFGRFVTLMGYEVIESPANLNFSRGLLFTNAIPTWHQGALASYKFNDIVDAQFGIVNGVNNEDSVSTGAFGNRGINDAGKGITGRVNVTAPGGNANIANSFYYNADAEPNAYANNTVNGTNNALWRPYGNSMFIWDMVGNWAPKFAKDKLLLGINTDLGFAEKAYTATAAGDGTNNNRNVSLSYYGVAAYAKYQFNKIFSLAARGEYFHDSNSFKVNPSTATNASQFRQFDAWSFTTTAGFDVWENMLLRLEYRYDDLDMGGSNSGLTASGGDQHTIAVNVVYSF